MGQVESQLANLGNDILQVILNPTPTNIGSAVNNAALTTEEVKNVFVPQPPPEPTPQPQAPQASTPIKEIPITPLTVSAIPVAPAQIGPVADATNPGKKV